MKIPSEEFWFKMGLCWGASSRLKELIDSGVGHKDVMDEERDRATFIWETLSEVCETVYEKGEMIDSRMKNVKQQLEHPILKRTGGCVGEIDDY